jgi:hypothetical protein
VEGLASITPSVESVRGLADSNLSKTVTAMLNLVEDASLFIVNYRSRSSWGALYWMASKYDLTDGGM